MVVQLEQLIDKYLGNIMGKNLISYLLFFGIRSNYPRNMKNISVSDVQDPRSDWSLIRTLYIIQGYIWKQL